MGYEGYDPAKFPTILFCNMGAINIFVADPEIVKELFTVKNNLIDKEGLSHVRMEPLLGNSLLFCKTDELWKAKRKACAHAFYKDRLALMMDTFLDMIMVSIRRWQKEIDESPNGFTQIDISYEFERIFSRSIITISFGEDISDDKIEMYKETERGSNEFLLKKISVREAINDCLVDLTRTFETKLRNPINLFWARTGKLYAVTKFEKIVHENCARLRAYVLNYIQERKSSGKRKSQFSSNVDQ